MSLRLTRRPDSQFWWIVGTIDGKRIRESTGCTSRPLAEQKCAARETQIYREAIHGVPAPRRSFAAVVLSYVEHGGPHEPDTLAKVDRLLTFFGPNTAADEVDQAAIDRACTALLRPLPSPATRLRQIISPARAILTHGAKRRMCQMPVFDTGKTSPSRTEWLEPAHVDLLIAAAAPHLRPLVAFLAGTGARMSEALALEWRDVDMRHARATLRDTKNGSDRIVDLCPRVMAALRYDPRAKKGVARMMVGRVFRTKAGRAFAERKVQGGGQVKNGWAGALKRAKISATITPHGLRHTWASWHYAMNKDALRLMSEGGWSSLDLVKRYTHLTPPGMAGEIMAWRAADTLLTRPAITSQKKKTKTAA